MAREPIVFSGDHQERIPFSPTTINTADGNPVTSVERGLAPDTRYIGRVRTINSFGVPSEWSEAIDFTTSADQTIPSSPQNLKVDFASANIFVEWDSVTTNVDGTTLNDFAQYEITLYNNKTPENGPFKFTTVSTSFSFLFVQNAALNNGTPSTSYDVEVVTVDYSGNKSESAIITATNNPPAAPILPPSAVMLRSNIDMHLQYDPSVTDVDHYVIYVREDVNVYKNEDFNIKDFLFPAVSLFSLSWGQTIDISYSVVDVFGEESPESPRMTLFLEDPESPWFIEVESYEQLPVVGESGKVYITTDTNIAYRWDKTAYAPLGDGSIALGETSSTAYRGDRGKTAYDHSQIVIGNPHGTTAADVGADPAGTAAALVDDLSGVSNQSDARDNLGLGNSATLDVGTTTSTVAAGDDSRFTDSRTPTAHASSHASAGSDPLTLAQSQITNLTVDLGNKVDTSRTVNGHALSSDVTVTASDVGALSTSGGTVNGDVTIYPAGAGKAMVTVDGSGVATLHVYIADSDTQPAFSLGQLFTYSALGFGPGGSTAPDTAIYRSSAGVVATTTLSATTVTGLSAPSASSDATNKSYVDARVAQPIAKESSLWYAQLGLTTASTSLGMTASGTLFAMPVWLQSGSYDKLGVITSVAAVSTWRLGVYPSSPTTGLPDGQTRVLDGNTVDMNATAGVQSVTVSLTIPSTGVYWLVALVDSYTATPTVYGWTSVSGTAQPPLLGAPVSFTSGTAARHKAGRSATGVATGSIPSTCPTLSWAEAGPRIGVRSA